jgi:hypothetical protein
MAYDWTTINRAELERLPLYRKPPAYQYQVEPGNGCYGDPPGFPTYYTQNVYTSHGNNPSKGPTLILDHHVIERAEWTPGETWETQSAARAELYRRLYVPLSIEHPRVTAWIDSQFRHFKHCYRDTEREEYGKPGTLIYPVPGYKLKTARIDPHWTDEYKATVQAEADAFNKQERERADRIAVPSNHLAVIYVREIYPTFEPTPAQLAGIFGSPYGPGDWWERHAERPSPAECIPPRWFGKHRSDGWCQFCGYVSTLDEAKQ